MSWDTPRPLQRDGVGHHVAARIEVADDTPDEDLLAVVGRCTELTRSDTRLGTITIQLHHDGRRGLKVATVSAPVLG